MDWSVLDEPSWWLKASVGFGVTLASFAIARSAVHIHRYGFRNYVRAALDLDPHSWMIIGILLFVAIAGMAGFISPFSPWSLVP